MPALVGARRSLAEGQLKQRSAALSVVSNSGLILLKVVAGTITGSVSLLTEAVHSSIDLVASIVAFFSVRKADEPADESHRYGHENREPGRRVSAGRRGHGHPRVDSGLRWAHRIARELQDTIGQRLRGAPTS